MAGRAYINIGTEAGRRELAFVKSFVEHGAGKGAGAVAVREAGYQIKHNDDGKQSNKARELLARPRVQQALAELKAQASIKLGLSPEVVLGGILVEARRTKGKNASHAARVTAWDKLARILDYYTPAEKAEADPERVIEKADVSTLRALVAKGEARLAAMALPVDGKVVG